MGRLRDLMDGYYRTLDTQGLEAASRYWSPTCEFTAPGMRGRGPEFIRDYIQVFYDGSPDLRHTVRRSVETGSTITLELEAHGSNTGSLRLPIGEVPPTGREWKVSVCVVVQVRDGAFSSYHIYFDMADFLAQIDLLPFALAT
jgi:predicted ester cyclase